MLGSHDPGHTSFEQFLKDCVGTVPHIKFDINAKIQYRISKMSSALGGFASLSLIGDSAPGLHMDSVSRPPS